MNILISCMGYDAGKSGISGYMRNVLANLRDTGHKITLVIERGNESDFAGFDTIQPPKIFSKSAAGFLWHLFALPFIAGKKQFDCLLILAGNRRFTLFSNVPQISVVHDLSQYRVTGKYDPLRMFYLTKVQPMLGRKFSAIAAISQSTLNDVIKHWQFPAENLTLNYNGLTRLARAENEPSPRLKYGKYIYYVSRIEHPGKNHLGLIKAYEMLPAELKREYALVFTGQNWNGAEIVRDYVKNSPDAARIAFTGFVTNEQLAALYADASAFAFPSFSEGFGLGLIEAMSFGVPCACSYDSSLGEIAGDAALLFDPAKPEEISGALKKILSEPTTAADLVKKGLERCKIFDWKAHAQTLLEICEKEYAKNSTAKIFGIKFRNARMDEIVREFAGCATRREKKTVGFLNTFYLNTAYENPAQAERLGKLDCVLPDGSGVSLACKILGIRYRDNLNGTDLLPCLCEVAQAEGYSMYFIGGKEGVAARAGENLKKTYPNLKIAGTRAGYFSKEEEPAIIAEINTLRPDFLFVGFGVIAQEKWVLENAGKLDATLVLATGGLHDVYSGDLFRVSPRLRRMGLEWLGRLRQEPRRLFGRYVIGNPLFICRVVKSKIFPPARAG